MSQEMPTDLLRWTFSVDPEKIDEIAEYLVDLGLDVVVHEDARFSVSWEDPDLDTDPIVEHLWALNGETFDITHESFHRLSLMVYHHDDQAEAA